MINFKTLTAALLASSIASTASAATLEFSDISVAWHSAVGGNIVSNTATADGDSASIRWGDGGGTSGYDFDLISDPVPNPAIPVDTIFDLGTFTHLNQSITAGTSITQVALDIVGDILVDGVLAANDATFSFVFDHNETPNSPGPCEGGDTVPCGDLVTVSLLNSTDTFTIGGVEYTMGVEGFIQNGVTTSTFFSDEGANNSAVLQASFTSEVPAVPLPAAGWMLIAAVGGLGAMRRRQKSA